MMVSNFAAICLSFGFILVLAGAFRHFDDQEMDFFRAADNAATTRAPKCVRGRLCITNAECAGEGQGHQLRKPFCAGGLAGICDCAACVGGLPCKDDSKCGGLIGACNNKTRTCNCLAAAQLHYDESDATQKAKFPTLSSAIADFCAKESCLTSAVNCHGLPCKRGVCICA